MRLVLAAFLSALSVGACGRSDPGQVRSDWGCSPVAGLETILSDTSARFILIGESVESNEAPNAIAAIACRLAEHGDSVLIGVSERTGGMTLAEAGLQRTVDYLSAEHGAMIEFALFEQPDERIAVRNRSDSERRQAQTIVDELDRIGVSRAVLLLPRSEATMSAFGSSGGRFSGYDPMAAHLPVGEVLSFEVARAKDADAAKIALRTYAEPHNGFVGELVLARLTHPTVETSWPKSYSTYSPLGGVVLHQVDPPAESRARREAETDLARRVRILAAGGEAGLPEYTWTESAGPEDMGDESE